MNEGAWHIITGEYPPAPGGVSDYSAILSGALASAGVEVHVWTGVTDPDGTVAAPGATVHRIADAWSETGLRKLGTALDGFPTPRRLLIQYVPNAWGQRGMNLEFCRWVERRGRAGDEVRLMIHEPFLPYKFSWGPARWYMAWVQRRMMRALLAAAHTVYVSIPGWFELIRPYVPHPLPTLNWLPVFSNIPVVTNLERVRELRTEIAGPQQLIVGSFGTFGGQIGPVTARVFMQVLTERTDSVGLLLGRGALGLAAQVLSDGSVPAIRLFAFEDLTPEEISLRLQGCDVMVQPYPDGISSRRGSALAGMAHGRTIVTNHGFLTDRVLGESGCLGKIGQFNPGELAYLVLSFLNSEESRVAFGEAAKETYDAWFSVARTVEHLLNDDAFVDRPDDDIWPWGTGYPGLNLRRTGPK